jgi:hypothetical protein
MSESPGFDIPELPVSTQFYETKPLPDHPAGQ